MGAPNPNDNSLTYVKRLVYLFGFVYFAQGIGQAAGLLSQPLNFYLKEALNLPADAATNYLAVLTIPWVIKPLYGLISDFIPLLGYRRKTWLVAMNGLSVLGFIWLTGLTDVSSIVFAMMLTAIGTAASDVIIDALMVENGQKFNATARFQSVQWFWFYIASISTSLAGGYLCEHFSPGTALHVAATITLFAPAAVIVFSWMVIREEKSGFNKKQLMSTVGGLKEAMRSKTLWAVALFIAFWNFSPSMGTPLYYHMVNKLGFSQGFIGTMGAIGAAGSVVGAWLYGKYFAKRTIKFQLTFSIIAGTVGSLSYLALITPSPYSKAIAIALSIVFGAAGTISTLATLTLAAKACPQKAEGFTFAALMSVNNGFMQLSAILGAWLFVNVFGENLSPLIWVSGIATFCCFALLPTLRGLKEGDDDGAK